MLRSVGLRILLLSVGLVLSDKDSFKKVGDKVVLSPGSVSDPITSITWKHGPDIAVEWYGGDIVPYRDFRGRCEVSTSTGTLTLSNVTVKDSGIYTAEINNRVMSPTKITVISAVPKPTVSKSCNPEMTICTLTCEASITDDTKPVTYSWMTGDKQTAQPSSNQLTLAKIFSRAVMFWGCRRATRTFNSRHRFSMGLRSGDWLGHSRTFKCFLRSHSFVARAVCFGSLSCWKT
uniref:Immunoglobulin domain-containing protein n=1 Tax=Astatotilapia calliptera TaxID=8154 RepID=A0A3P8Q0A1_ASTCA